MSSPVENVPLVADKNVPPGRGVRGQLAHGGLLSLRVFLAFSSPGVVGELSVCQREFGVVPHAVAVATDVDDVAVLQEAVDERGGHDP